MNRRAPLLKKCRILLGMTFFVFGTGVFAGAPSEKILPLAQKIAALMHASDFANLYDLGCSRSKAAVSRDVYAAQMKAKSQSESSMGVRLTGVQVSSAQVPQNGSGDVVVSLVRLLEVDFDGNKTAVKRKTKIRLHDEAGQWCVVLP